MSDGLDVVIRPLTNIAGAVPTLGAMLGSGGSSKILQNLSSQVGQTYFGTAFDEVNNSFMNMVVKPLIDASTFLTKHQEIMINPNAVLELTTVDDFMAVPEIMRPMLLEHPLLSALHENGCVSAWGYEPEDIDPTRPHYRLATLPGTRDILLDSDKDGMVTMRTESWSDDPELDFDSMCALRQTYFNLEHIIETTDVDPTEPRHTRG